MAYVVTKLIFVSGVILGGGCQTLKLVGSPSNMPNAGRVEINIQDTWHEICYTSTNITHEWIWGIDNVIWACRELGYPGAWIGGQGKFGNGLLGRSVDYFDCQPDTDGLLQCQHGHPKNASCEPGNSAFVICTEPNYVGCFKDQLPRAMPYGIYEDAHDMSVTKCIEHCKQFDNAPFSTTVPRYAGVQDGRQCFCGMENTQYMIHGKAQEKDCAKVVCPGDSNEACGGIWKMGVYDVTKGYCDEQVDPGNGTRFKGLDYPRFGSSALFQCDPGYVLLGQNMTQCVVGSTPEECDWSSDVPYCADERYLTTTPYPSSTTPYPSSGNPTSNKIITLDDGKTPKTDEIITSDDGKTPKTDVEENKEPRKRSNPLLAILIGVVAFALFILILSGIIMCFFFGVVRGRKKTRHKHSESSVSTNGEARVNEGYTHDDSSNNPVTVAVISNGRQHPSPKRNPTGNETQIHRDNQVTRDTYTSRGPADASVTGVGLRTNGHTSENGQRRANEPLATPAAVVNGNKEEEIIMAYDGSEDESEGSLSLNLNEVRHDGEERNDSIEEEAEDGRVDGREDNEEEVGSNTEDAVGSNTGVEADVAESGYTSDYFGLNGVIDGGDKDRSVMRTGSNHAANVDHYSLR